MSSVDMVAAIDKTLQLHDARTLGYTEYGSAEGTPLFYFHGHPGLGFEARLLAAHVDVRLNGALLGRPWGFKLEAIAFPRLYLWHGELDRKVSVATA
jgi:hypothetical protein